MSKNKIQNYIILEFLKNYATLVVIFALVIWITQAVRLLDLVYQDGNSFLIYGQYTIYQLPKIISKISIVIFLITIFWTLNNLEDSNELRTISYFGIEPKIIFLNFLKFSFVFTFILIIFKAFVVPYFNKNSRDLLNSEGISSFASLLRENNFNNPSKNTTIYIEKKNRIGELKNIIIFQLEDDDKNKTIIAKTGLVTNLKNKSYLVTENGVIQELDSKGSLSQISFDKITTDVENFKKKTADYYKMSEYQLSELLNRYNEFKNSPTRFGVISELSGMCLIPLIIPSITLLGFFAFSNHDFKVNKKLLKFYLFSIGFISVLLSEIIVAYIQKNILFFYFFIFFLLSFFFIIFLIFKRLFRNANN